MHKLWLAFEAFVFSCPAGSFFLHVIWHFGFAFFLYKHEMSMNGLTSWGAWRRCVRTAADECKQNGRITFVHSSVAFYRYQSTEMVLLYKEDIYLKSEGKCQWGFVSTQSWCASIYMCSLSRLWFGEVSFYIEGSYSVCSSWWRSAWYFRLFQKKRFNSFFLWSMWLEICTENKRKNPSSTGKKHHYTLRKSLFFLTLFHTNSSVAKKD